MSYFNKLPGFTRTPAGFEWVLLKKLPMILGVGTAMAAAPIFYIYFSENILNPEQLKHIYLCLGLIFSVWFFTGVVAIGCFVVMIMKGPAYVADPYELPKENKKLEKHPNL
jgi:hypothetical protein